MPRTGSHQKQMSLIAVAATPVTTRVLVLDYIIFVSQDMFFSTIIPNQTHNIHVILQGYIDKHLKITIKKLPQNFFRYDAT